MNKEKLDAELIKILNSVEMISAKEIITQLRWDWKDDKMKRNVNNKEQVEKIKVKNRIYYRLKGNTQLELFDDQL